MHSLLQTVQLIFSPPSSYQSVYWPLSTSEIMMRSVIYDLLQFVDQGDIGVFFLAKRRLPLCGDRHMPASLSFRCRCCSCKMRQSYISKTVWPRITKFYVNIRSRQIYNQTWYDVTMYFRSEVIDVRKRAVNDVFDGFNLESRKLAHASIPTSWSTIPDMTSLTTSVGSYRSLKNGLKCRIRQLRCFISRGLFELESPNFACTSTPSSPTFAPDMTSWATSGRKLHKNSRKCLSDGFRWNFSIKVYAKITKFHTVVGDNWPHKSAGYDVASCFFLVLDLSDEFDVVHHYIHHSSSFTVRFPCYAQVGGFPPIKLLQLIMCTFSLRDF